MGTVAPRRGEHAGLWVPDALKKRLKDDGSSTHSAAWRQSAQRHRLMLYDDLARFEGLSEAEERERRYLANVVLDDADDAINVRVGPVKWWWGTEIERAWARLREVEERTIDLVPAAELPVYAANASSRGGRYLEPGDARLAYLDGLRVEHSTRGQVSSGDGASSDEGASPRTDDGSHQTAALRSATVLVLRKVHGAIDRANREARYLRNRIILASLLGVFFGVILVITQWEVEEPFLATPTGGALRDPAWRYVLVVMTWGAVGALLTAIPAMTKTPADFGPFNLPLQQSMLKIVLGPLSAVVGFAILSEEPFGATAPTEWPGLMLLAIAFGAGQQAVTRYVDQRAATILSAAAPHHARDR